jgi:hypothetical protein
MEVFSLLYSPAYKMDLALYWHKLEAQNLDPVMEYNRTLESMMQTFKNSTHDLFIFMI